MKKQDNINSQEIVKDSPIFSGHIYIFFAFDIGDDLNLEKIRQSQSVQTSAVNSSKFFKNYHAPISIELPHPHDSAHFINGKLHKFGALSMTYKIPVLDTFQNLRSELINIDQKYQHQSIDDARSIYKKIMPFITKPNFFHLRNYYTMVQIDTNENFNGAQIKDQYGNDITALLRLEKENLSEYQKMEILNASIAYFKQDLVIIDTEAALVYDPQYEELLDFFELGNIQQLELQYFDKLLDKQMTSIYEDKTRKLPLAAYLPFIGPKISDPVGDLTRLKVDISVITERLEGSIKLVGETYFSAIYDLIVKKMDLKSWHNSIEKKFSIIKEIRYHYQNKIDATREDILTMLIIILILLELIVATLRH